MTLLQPDPRTLFVLRHDYSTCLIYAYEHAGLADGLILSEFTSSCNNLLAVDLAAVFGLFKE